MNIGFKPNNHINKKKLNQSGEDMTSRQATLSNSKNNNFNNQKSPSFKARFTDIDKILTSVETEIGPAFKEMFIDSLNQANSAKKPMLSYDKAKGILDINDKSPLKRAIDLAVYPVTAFPLDIVNATIGKLKHIPGLKGLEKIAETPLLKNRSMEHENIANISAIENFIAKHNEFDTKKRALIKSQEVTKDEAEKKKIGKEIEKLEEKYKDSMVSDTSSSFDLAKGNYDSTVERGITRAVTGIIPAFFLANDAYNLSIYMNDDKKVAKEAKKKRFNQEVARIGLTAGLTYGILKIFSKSSNKSAALTAWLITAVTFASEVVGRQMVGTPVLPVSEQKAKQIANDRKQKKSKHIDAKLQDENTLKDTAIEAKKPTQISQQPTIEAKKSEKKHILTMENALKGLGGLVVLGLAQDKLFKIGSVKKFAGDIGNYYTNFLQKDKKIKSSEFKAMLEHIENSGLKPLAEKYQKIVDDIKTKGNLPYEQQELVSKKIEDLVNKKFAETYPKQEFAILDTKFVEDTKNGIRKQLEKADVKKSIIAELGLTEDSEYIHLGRVEHKVKTIIVDQILMFPVRFAWTILSAPYDKIVKPLAKYIGDCPPGPKEKKGGPTKDFINIWNNYEKMLKKAKKAGIDKTPDFSKKFTDELKKKALSSMNTETKSGISNADLSALIKNAASTTTSAFLIVDNYNMVMVDSEGKDKDLAAQKTKERGIQRLVRIIYGAFIIKLCNNIFSGPYNGSLLGAQTVNASQTYLIETLERKSVGLKTGESNKNDIIKLENENLQATGLKGGYFRAMAKLTGHKGMSAEAESVKKKAQIA